MSTIAELGAFLAREIAASNSPGTHIGAVARQRADQLDGSGRRTHPTAQGGGAVIAREGRRASDGGTILADRLPR